MATVRNNEVEQNEQPLESTLLDAYLADLGDLSRRHGIAISDGGMLYLMEAEDFSRSYLASDRSELTFC